MRKFLNWAVDAVRMRFWIIAYAFVEIPRRISRRGEWDLLRVSVLTDEFFIPFFHGHIEKRFNEAVLEAGYLNDPPVAAIVSVSTIMERVRESFRYYMVEKYEMTGVLKGYARASLLHFNFCARCQNESVHYYGQRMLERVVLHGARAMPDDMH